MREYALDRLEIAGDADSMRAAHADYYSDLVARTAPQEGLCAVAAARGDGERAGALSAAAAVIRQRIGVFDIRHNHMTPRISPKLQPMDAAAVHIRLRDAQARLSNAELQLSGGSPHDWKHEGVAAVPVALSKEGLQRGTAWVYRWRRDGIGSHRSRRGARDAMGRHARYRQERWCPIGA